jgi:hypothetical protein
MGQSGTEVRADACPFNWSERNGSAGVAAIIRGNFQPVIGGRHLEVLGCSAIF